MQQSCNSLSLSLTIFIYMRCLCVSVCVFIHIYVYVNCTLSLSFFHSLSLSLDMYVSINIYIIYIIHTYTNTHTHKHTHSAGRSEATSVWGLTSAWGLKLKLRRWRRGAGRLFVKPWGSIWWVRRGTCWANQSVRAHTLLQLCCSSVAALLQLLHRKGA